MNLSLKLAIIAAIIPMIGIGAVYAVGTNITGVVNSGGSALNDAKSTAERAGEYQWDRTDASGNYDLATTTTNSYTVESMKSGYTRDSDSVTGGNSAPTQTISTRSYTDVKFKVGYDTTKSVTLSQAKDWLLDGEPWFRDEHSIDFVETTASESWTSSGATATCAGFLSAMNSDIGWTGGDYGGADILFGFTDNGFSDAVACINTTPGAGGTHPYIVADGDSSDMARTVMHEMSHAYGFSHNTSTCSTQIPGIMAIGPGPGTCSSSIYIKNWVPSDDTTLESRRSWY